MQLYCFVTEAYRPLYDEFLLPSAKNNFDVHLIEGLQQGEAVFGNQQWHDTIYDRVNKYRQIVRDAPEGTVLAFFDADVVMFGLTEGDLLEALADADLAAHGQGRGLGMGNLVVRVNDKTRQLLDKIAADPDGASLQGEGTDSAALRAYRDMAHCVSLQPPRFWSLLGGQRTLHRCGRRLQWIRRHVPPEMKLFHATNAHLVRLDAETAALPYPEVEKKKILMRHVCSAAAHRNEKVASGSGT